MKYLLLPTLIIFSVLNIFAQSSNILEKLWSTDTLLRTPESAFYNKEKKEIYVTNMNTIHDNTPDGDGFISIVDLTGKIKNLKWISGLDDPKGMAIFKDKLYVGDLKNLVEIDLKKGSIIKKYTTVGTIFLNDVAVDANGVVYVTDSFANKVFRLKNGKLELWIDGKGLDKPNGIYIDKDLILIANMNEGIVYKINAKTELEKWSGGLPSADGIAPDNAGNFYISNWHGEVYQVEADKTVVKLLDSKANKINAADIEFIQGSNILLVPTFFGNHLSAYKVKL